MRKCNMIHYRDMTFCSSKNCINQNCHRHQSNINYKEAERLNLYIAFADFEKVNNGINEYSTCPDFISLKQTHSSNGKTHK